MSDSHKPSETFKVRIGNYLSECELEELGISADWFLYLSPTIPPAMATCITQYNTYKLLGCPCCGGSAGIIGTHPTNEYSAICRDCGLETAHKMLPSDAASDWNKRHAPDEEGTTPPESGAVTEAMVEAARNAAMSIQHNKEPWFPMTDSRLRRALTAALAQGGGNER